ncbi:unnamed protein product [Peniophora sp. CBMAI 1063]|nr:unnamed protein product [Peniophora sp. CBMAI 1063]
MGCTHRRSSSVIPRNSSFSQSTAASRARSVLGDNVPPGPKLVNRPAPVTKAERRVSMPAPSVSQTRYGVPHNPLVPSPRMKEVHPIALSTRRHSLAVPQARVIHAQALHTKENLALGRPLRDYSNLPTRRDRALSFFRDEPDRRRAFLDSIDPEIYYDEVASPTSKLASAGTFVALARIHRRSTPNALDMTRERSRSNSKTSSSAGVTEPPAPRLPRTPPRQRLPTMRSSTPPPPESSSILVTSRARWPAHPPTRAPLPPPTKSRTIKPPPPIPPRSYQDLPTDHPAIRTIPYPYGLGPPPFSLAI